MSRARPSDDAEVRALRERLSRALDAWPDVRVDVDALVARACGQDDDDAVAPAVVHADDLALAAACAAGSPSAHRAFDAALLGQTAAWVRTVDPAPAFADEVRQELRTRLLLPSPDGPPRIAGYAGRGPLAGWVRVTAVRTARNVRRARGGAPGRDVDVGEAQLGGLVVAQGDDPELAYLKARGGRVFREAFEAALAGLGTREQALLRLTYVERLASQEIGKLYGVTGSAVRAWLAKVRTDLVARVRDALGAQLAEGSDELRALVGLVESRFDLTLSRVLGEGHDAPVSRP